jgi:hypothetical protein
MGRKGKETMEAERKIIIVLHNQCKSPKKVSKLLEDHAQPYRPLLTGLDCEGRTKISAEQCSYMPNDKRGPVY